MASSVMVLNSNIPTCSGKQKKRQDKPSFIDDIGSILRGNSFFHMHEIDVAQVLIEISVWVRLQAFTDVCEPSHVGFN
jgi:hypothetical protein